MALGGAHSTSILTMLTIFRSNPGRAIRSSVQEDGEVWFYGIVTKTEQLGNRQIGIDYLKELSQLVDGQFDDSYREWNWCVRRSGQYIVVDEYLRRRSDWKNLMENLLERIQEVIEEE